MMRRTPWSACAICVVLLISATDRGDADPLVVGADIDYAPFSYMQDGVPKGFDIDFFDLLASTIGIDVRYELAAWAEIHDRIRSGEIDAVLGLLYTPEREEYLKFTKPYNSFDLAVVVGKHVDVSGIGDLSGRTMAVLENDALPQLLLRKRGIEPKTTEFPTLSEAVSSVARGAHEFCVVPAPYLEELAWNGYEDELQVLSDGRLVATYRIGVAAERRVSVETINDAVDRVVGSEAYHRLERKWFDPPYETPPDTGSRREWIAWVTIGGLALAIFVAGVLFQWLRVRLYPGDRHG